MPFNAEDFMTQTIDQPLETERTLVPPGEYKMVIDDFTQEAFETFEFEYKRGPNAGQPGQMTKFGCPCIVVDDKVKADLGMEKVTVFKNITLDFDDTGAIAFGKNRNIDLGQLRHAVGQNNPGPWSIAQLRGAGPFMGRVEHREGKRKDGSAFKIAEVTRVAPIR